MTPSILSLLLPKCFYSLFQESSPTFPGQERDINQPPSLLSTPSSSPVCLFSNIGSGAQKSEVLQDGLVSLPHDSSVTSAAGSECYLFSLPPEIRQQIWRDVLGGHTFHLQFSQGRLTSLHCGDPSSKWCKGTYCRGFWHVPQDLSNRKLLFISILSTCKQICTEAIDILYSENTFAARNGDAVVRLASTVPLVHTNRIRSLRLICPVTSEPPIPFHQTAIETPVFTHRYATHRQGGSLARQSEWAKIWDILASMSSLRHLDVSMRLPDRASGAEFNAEGVEKLLEPIKKLIAAKPGVLVLGVPFDRATKRRTHSSLWLTRAAEAGREGDNPWDQLGCKIRRA